MRRLAAILRRVRRRDGQVLPLMAICMVVLLGMAALVIDVGRVYVAQQQLQAAVNSAALAAGDALPNASNAYSDAVSYSGVGTRNAVNGGGVTANQPTVTFECASYGQNYVTGSPPTCPTDTSGKNCQPTGAQTPSPSGVTTCNAARITETATVNTTIGGIFLPSFTVSASATAAARGGVAHPLNVFVIADNTVSMMDDCSTTVTGNGNPGDTTSVSSPKKLDCAKAGVRALLQALWPCDNSTGCGAVTQNASGLGYNVANPDDEVGLLVIPAITGNPPATSTLDEEIDCNSRDSFSDEYPPWTNPTNTTILDNDAYLGYEAVGLSSDYRASSAGTALNWYPDTDGAGMPASPLVEAVDWGQCSGKTYPGYARNDVYGLKDIGGVGSYLAGAITEAQYLLQQNARPGADNVIIIESDGEMNSSTRFSNGATDTTACEDAYNAAQAAKAAPYNDTIYTIEYDSNGSCGPDSPTDAYDNADTLMKDMASDPADYFDDPGAGDLTADFQQVGSDLTDPRLIPNCTQAPPAC